MGRLTSREGKEICQKALHDNAFDEIEPYVDEVFSIVSSLISDIVKRAMHTEVDGRI